MRRLLAAAVLVMGCVAPADDEVVLPSYDYERFVIEVQPILASRCANPTCHGNAERPLSLYSPLAWRADETRTYLIEDITEGELQHNYDVSRALASGVTEPEETLLLRKPLGNVAATYHGGGDVFEGDTDRDYRTMLDWLRRPVSP